MNQQMSISPYSLEFLNKALIAQNQSLPNLSLNPNALF